MKATFLAIVMVLGMSSVAMAEVPSELASVLSENVAEFKVQDIAELPKFIRIAFETEFSDAAIKEVQSNGIEIKISFNTSAGDELCVFYSTDGDRL